jgi:hypothetical protein
MNRSGFDWCVHCGRPLHDERSRTIGLGPECEALPECAGLLKMIAGIERNGQPLLFGEGMDGSAEADY